MIARTYAGQLGLFPPPNPRNLINTVADLSRNSLLEVNTPW